MASAPTCPHRGHLGPEASDGVASYDSALGYRHGSLASPNMVLLGQAGTGKSTLVKCLLGRVWRTIDGRRRRVQILDVRGEYGPLAEALGLARLRLAPRGPARLNPLDLGPVPDLAERRREVVETLAALSLGRHLGTAERAAVAAALGQLPPGPERRPPTLAHVMALLERPGPATAAPAAVDRAELAEGARRVRVALAQLLEQLGGAIDGPTSGVDADDGDLVVDLRAFRPVPGAAGAVLVAATAWLGAHIADATEPWLRYRVLDEGWTATADEHSAGYLHRSWIRTEPLGVANIVVLHRLEDLRWAPAVAGSPLAAGNALLADTATRVIFRQSIGHGVDRLAQALGLDAEEAAIVGHLPRGGALWKTGAASAIRHHTPAPDEWGFCEPGSRMAV
jgi:hypothetical protein